MKTIVIYHSQTGFTERYAGWIAEAAGADCLALAEAKTKDFAEYDAIVFGSWACAGGISKLSWLKSRAASWADKRLVAFCVGGSPLESPNVKAALQKNFRDPALQGVRAFYCPGGFNYEKMPAPSRLMMKVFLRTLKMKKEKTEEEKMMVQMISSSYDFSDKKYIEPILKCLEE